MVTCSAPARRRAILAVLAAAALVSAAVAVVALRTERFESTTPPCAPRSAGEAAPDPPGADDALQERTLDDLRVFTDWLRDGDARGFIGEVGWPSGDADRRWNELAGRWYEEADRSDLWITAWAAGEWWGGGPLVVYGDPSSEMAAAPSASVVEAGRSIGGARRGINVNGGEFGIGPNLGIGSGGSFSNDNPGTYDETYRYESSEMFELLATRCLDLIRLPFRWERIQPVLGAPLDRDEVDRLRAALLRADQAGLDAIPTVMNYGAYWLGEDETGSGVRHPIGSDQVSIADFADLWTRLTDALSDLPNIVAWGLMNEPVDMPGGAAGWEVASQGAVDAIRRQGDDRIIMVPGYDFSTVVHFPSRHPEGPWINDPLGLVRYEAHHYFDHDMSGSYELTYGEELERVS
jgi:hypothetical protein